TRDRGVVEVRRNIEHRADRQVDRVRTQQLQPTGAGDVVQVEAHAGLRGAERGDDLRQQVEDGRTACGDVQLAGVEPAQLLAERGVEAFETFHQRPRQFVQRLALPGHHQPPATAL